MVRPEEILYRQIWEKRMNSVGKAYDDGELRIAMAASFTDCGKRLLDVGCGDGSFILRVKDQFEEVFGLDISPMAVELCRKNGIKASQINLNGQTTPYPDGFFDTIVSLEVIEHVFNPLSFSKEINRALRPGGTLIISTQIFENSRELFQSSWDSSLVRLMTLLDSTAGICTILLQRIYPTCSWNVDLNLSL
jgi:2-polyprenyl-3-methyl-5-hydroxy-6-metoxy-1,4-benzoquinol methylase